MRQLLILLLILVFAISFGCDNNPTTFEDSIPLYTLETSVSPEEGGTVEPSEGEFSSGNRVQIEATPSEGYVFERWEGDLTTNSNPAQLVFNSNRSVIANFTLRNYDLNIKISGEGKVRETVLDSSDTESGASSVKSVRLEAVAKSGWIFDRWEGDLTGSENPAVISVEEEKSVTAVFDRSSNNGFTISIDIEGEGTVNREPNRTNFSEGDEVILTAIPASGWTFFEWQGDLTGTENSQTITITDDVIAKAVFGPFEDPFLEISDQPSATVAGKPVSPFPEVKLLNELGDPVSDAEISVALNKNSFSSASETTLRTNSDGIALFDELIIESAETGYILTFSSDFADVSDLSTTPFEVVSAEADPSSSSADMISEGSVGENIEIIIHVEDAFGNKVSGASTDLSAEISGANSSSPEVTEVGNGEYLTSYTPTHAGTDVVTIRLDGTDISGSPFEIEVSAGTPSEIEITQQPSNVTAGIAIDSAPAIRVVDGFGNALEGVNVSAELDGANFADESTTSRETNSNGIATFNNLVIRTAGTGYRIRFETGDLNKNSERFNVNPADVDLSMSSATVPDGVTGEETVIRISLADRFENGVGGVEDGLTVDIRRTNNFNLTVTETETPGEYIARYTPLRRGEDLVDIKFDGNHFENSPYISMVSAADINVSNSSVSANPEVATSGGFSTVSVELRDDNGNPIGGFTAEDFGISLSGNASAGAIRETSTAGTYEFNVTSIAVGEVTVSITADGISLNDTALITFEAGSPDRMEIVVQPENTRSGESIEGPPTVRVFDELGHPVPGAEVRVREQGGQEFANGTLTVTTNKSGRAQFDDLVIVTNVRWFNLVFSVDGLDDVVSDRFRVSFIER